MTINKFTPMHKILAAYPQLIDKMIERNHGLVYLKVPVSPCENSYCASVANVAKVVGENETAFVDFLREEINKIEIQYRY